MDEITPKLQELLQRHLRFADQGQNIDMSRDLRDLGLDSMTAIDLLLDLEKTFAFTFPDNVIVPDTFRTGDNLREAITSILGGDAP